MADKKELNVSDKEIELIKSIFAGNDDLLKAIRSCFFGFELNDTERLLIKTIATNKDVIKLMLKRIIPTLSRETPVGQVMDSWMGVEQQLIGQSRDSIYQTIKTREEVIKLIELGFNRLEDESVKIDLTPQYADSDLLAVKLLTRNAYVRQIETQLYYLKIIAGMKSESVAEAKKRMQVDSSE